MNEIDLSTEITGIPFSSPLFSASGTAGYGEKFLENPPLGLGGFVTKGISLNPREGNPPPRISETPCGLLNAIGLENIGWKRFLTEIIPRISNRNVPLIVNMFGETVEELCELSVRLSKIPIVRALELNVSCPNVKAGGISFGKDEGLLHTVVAKVKQHSGKPLWVKLTPNVTDIARLAQVVESAGGDAVTIANSYQGLSVDCESERFNLGNVTGGLTGPAVKPMTQYAVWEVVKVTHVPIIASGGISTAKDALEYLLLGARAIQIGTAALCNPGIFSEVLKGIHRFFKRKGINKLDQWIGRIRENYS